MYTHLISLVLFAIHFIPSYAHSEHEKGVSQVQFCPPSNEGDICLALTSNLNTTTQVKDLYLHISVRLPEKGTGWGAFGIGDVMSEALMFVIYPGEKDDGVQRKSPCLGEWEVVANEVSGHAPPHVTQTTPEFKILKTWTGDENTQNARVVCYGCETWGGKKLNITSVDQAWIWSVNPLQATASSDLQLPLKMHTDYGVEKLNMAAAFSVDGDTVVPHVSESRISSSPHRSGGGVDLVVVHGIALGSSFFVLTIGTFAIRSGLAGAFSLHWMIQLVAGAVAIIGCLIGINISFAVGFVLLKWLGIPADHGTQHGTFATPHQFLGILVLLGITVEFTSGYLDHVSINKFRSRSKQSYYHVWCGRFILLAGNINVGLGLKLADASSKSFFVWVVGLVMQLLILVPMWYFSYHRKDIIRPKSRSGVVEGEAFIVSDEIDGDSEEEEGGRR
ncbi:hypothetical protein G7Y89_g14367 [Cudoniella acicularis]|uniref:Cellobiose dehydrogenase-like cytochrome domain-containing protein n=1 Tax=Cudoniella acicularis TaxID=354080 RepID=A0A8H4R5R3_9HELO|nr:hypothetical protein G7Y89_g14367 [Cudoniella acicularis]